MWFWLLAGGGLLYIATRSSSTASSTPGGSQSSTSKYISLKGNVQTFVDNPASKSAAQKAMREFIPTEPTKVEGKKLASILMVKGTPKGSTPDEILANILAPISKAVAMSGATEADGRSFMSIDDFAALVEGKSLSSFKLWVGPEAEVNASCSKGSPFAVIPQSS